MASTSRWISAFILLVAAIASIQALAGDPPSPKPAAAAPPAPNPPKVLVTISKETTCITKPLRKDGYVDYIAALNERLSDGVTPENNAAVLFWKAVGPQSIEKSQRVAFFKMLGIPPLPETGDYFIPLREFVRQEMSSEKSSDAKPRDKNDKEFDAKIERLKTAMEQPWSSKEFPILARWLAANEKPLEQVVKASKRPRRYDPMIDERDQGLIAVLLPGLQGSSSVARALVARAMSRTNEGRLEAAWADLLSCHRLARLAGQGPTLIDALVGDALETIACGGDRGVLAHGGLSKTAAMRMLDDLDNLPPLPRMVDKVNAGDRFMFLDSIALTARDGMDRLLTLTDLVSHLSSGGNHEDEIQKLRDRAASLKNQQNRALAEQIDWDFALRMGNSWYDRWAEALQMPDRDARVQALRIMKADYKAVIARTKTNEWKSQVLRFRANPLKADSRPLADVFITLLLPELSSANNAQDRTAMRLDVTRLGFALAIYHAEHGAYPAKLAELVPKYVAAIPQDVFIAEDLHYKREGDGYLLYSVGFNCVDEGGKGDDDCKNGETWDDIAVGVPDSSKSTQDSQKQIK